ncbi:3-dehydroquinate synthase [Tepidiforma thermophila]|uniref:Multifunctional fusion protein n=1 Tax=Tepidiforma thermophila (strain KCTC 52669 / CGMCC 1.13589 / G233) TaxID=2761530 RepID=A0A2A9HJ30_TEPT2|nr:3-dehydroquinate synthase [Tepidiforma thermophila]PFG75045.1 3-dehydroquinate synthase [Tepidiforma thermophila]
MVPRRIFLIGLSGSGKSTTGRILARRLGWEFIDTDDEIEREAGRTVAELFAAEGEAAFRQRELRALERAAAREPAVIATGGGAPTIPAARPILGTGFVVWLAVSPAVAAQRILAAPNASERPLLAGDPRARLEALHQARIDLYRGADAAVDCDDLTPEEQAEEIERLWYEWQRDPAPPAQRFYSPYAAPRESAPGPIPEPAAIVTAPGGTYPVLVGEGALGALGAICRDLDLDGRAFIITDTTVGPLFASRAESALESAGYTAATFAIPAGEEHKNLQTLSAVYDFLIDHRIERTDFVVTLGGGVVTDLAGFAAATILRGVPFLHAPTSLLAMADAAIGGKTGIDHPRGKNLIGAFAQPRAVVIDPLLLRTLPERQLRNGWAELLKHGFILDEPLVRDLEAASVDGPPLTSADLIARSVAIKAAIVSEDERESGRRTLLNYGHTVGHAIEAVTGYQTYLHGEAVAIGMRAAGIIAVELGLLPSADFERQQALIRRFGLPETAPGLDPRAVFDATLVDKKVRAGAIRWVLLERIGQAVVRQGVPDALVHHAIETVTRP